MDAIKIHIDNMFDDLPETDEIKRIKNDIYLNALDRKEELLAEGKSENEAIGTIIIEIGDRDVLLDEMGYDKEEDLRRYSVNSLEDVDYYLAMNRIESRKIAFGIIAILFAFGLVPTLNTYNIVVIGVIILLLVVALAVALFIFSGFRLEALEGEMEDQETLFYLLDEDYAHIEERYYEFQETERYRIPLGVVLCIVSVIPLLVFVLLDRDLLMQRYGILALLILVGLGVYQFVNYGMIKSAYEKVLNIGEYDVHERQFQKRLEPLSNIYWMVITLIYLVWSFTRMSWGISWIVWPIAGILWSLFALIYRYISR